VARLDAVFAVTSAEVGRALDERWELAELSTMKASSSTSLRCCSPRSAGNIERNAGCASKSRW